MPNLQKPAPSKGTVVLLHGLLRSSGQMNKIAKALEADDYRVINIDYPTRVGPIQNLIEIVWDKCTDEGIDYEAPTHFVGYSLGALIVRGLVSHHSDEMNFGRLVLLAPPNGGSEVADFHKNNPLYKWIAGPVGEQLTIAKNPILNLVLGDSLAGYEAGIIAGSQTLDPLHSGLLPEPHDGKVSVLSTLLDGVSDHIVLEANHTFFPQTNVVIIQTQHFLNHGRFTRTYPR